jgi:hypothetical protein
MSTSIRKSTVPGPRSKVRPPSPVPGRDARAKWVVAVAAAMGLGGCFPDFQDPDLQVRNLTPEELKAPPGAREIKSAVVYDIRERRFLHLVLDQGHPAVPPDITLDKHGVEAFRTADKFELWRITVRQDPVDKVFAVNEVAYWDNERHVYYYNYEGGTPHRDVWMGPFPVKFSQTPAEHDHKH